MTTNEWDFWQRRLAGEQIPIQDGNPQTGFYRVRTRDKTSWRTVAYWREDGQIRCQLDGKDLDEQRACELWPWASQHPITVELYDAVRAGEPWPDLNAVVTAMSNRPPADDSFEALQERIDDLAREAERLIKAGAATNKDIADQAADVANKLGQLRQGADTAREAEKRPHLQACRDVDDKWRPLLTAADIYKRLKDVVINPFLRAEAEKKARAEAEARRKAEEERRAAEAAEREAQRKAEEAARSADAKAQEEARRAIEDAEVRARTAAAAEQRAQDIASATVTAGTRGRSVGLRKVQVVTIEDRAAVLAHFADREEITELLQKLAERAVKAGVKVPGVKVTQEAKAA